MEIEKRKRALRKRYARAKIIYNNRLEYERAIASYSLLFNQPDLVDRLLDAEPRPYTIVEPIKRKPWWKRWHD